MFTAAEWYLQRSRHYGCIGVADGVVGEYTLRCGPVGEMLGTLRNTQPSGRALCGGTV
jgi:hypothetical protein